MAKTSHKHRAKLKLESLGWTVGDVEKWIPQAKRRIDLFGIIDLVALRNAQTLGLQITSDSGGNVSAHVNKMLDEPRLQACLSAGWIVELWGVRNRAVRDGSFAVTRTFGFTHGGRRVAAFNESVVL